MSSVDYHIELVCTISVFPHTEDESLRASYCLVVTDRKRGRDGNFVEIIGMYKPHTKPSTIEVKKDRAIYWLTVGAQPSTPVARLLQMYGINETFDSPRRSKPAEKQPVEVSAPQLRYDAFQEFLETYERG